MEVKIDISKTAGELSMKHKLTRCLWQVTWALGTFFLPRSLGAGWKRFLLRLFGANIGKGAVVYSSASIYYPKNLVLGNYSTIDARVKIYNVAPIYIGDNTIISQGAFLCTASHDITDPMNKLVTASIDVKDQVWIAAETFVGMGVTIGQGGVVGARTVVFKDVAPWMVVVGNPARVVKERIVKTAE